MRKSRYSSPCLSASPLIPPSPTSFLLSFLFPLPLVVYSSAPPSFCLSVFFFSTRLLCALPVSQRIPLVAQLRDSAGKLRLFKARSAGKASSCWREAAWTWRTSPSCLHTLAHKHTRLVLKHSPLLPCLPAFPTWKMPVRVRFLVFAVVVDICDRNKGDIFSSWHTLTRTCILQRVNGLYFCKLNKSNPLVTPLVMAYLIWI